MNRGSTGMNRGSTGMNLGITGKVLKCYIPPGVTGKDRRGTVNNRDGDVPSTGANTDPGRATATPR
ncbi:hypothetical protein DPMN_060105 [Dreissena polymorpha]|uniref:Uncharacterized protein n=1 Tax=Dreissena polymorpha TaxID=45954 RepID=A0A9D4C544_DREPO|nr:hypothetical protein DPMN_060105 [Dreissena polymorpha]